VNLFDICKISWWWFFYGICLPLACKWFCLTCLRSLAEGFMTSAWPQIVSNSVLHMQNFLLKILWYLPALRGYVNLIYTCKTSCWWFCGICLPSACEWLCFTYPKSLAQDSMASACPVCMWIWFIYAKLPADSPVASACSKTVSDSVWYVQKLVTDVFW